MEEKKFLKLKRFYTDGTTHPFDKIEWTTSKVEIKDIEGNIIFNQDVEHPAFWDYMSVRVCADKYFKIKDLENHPSGGERSVKDVMHRVAYTISKKGKELGYIDEEGEKILYDELCYILINQIAAFNSPVFFNMGLWDVYGFKGTSNAPRWAIKERDGEVYKQDFEYQNGQYSACKAADTKIVLRDQGELTIKELFDNLHNFIKNEKSIYIYGLDYSKLIAVKYNGKKLTYKIILEESELEPLRITIDDAIMVRNHETGVDSFKTIESLIKDGYKDLHVRVSKPGFFTQLSKIKTIEEYKEEDVYDIETEAHNFSANGIVVHNCFITQVKDELINGENGIYDWIMTEMSIFANGSGSGVNVSDIRGKNEPIAGGGRSSGLISFLELADTSAGVIKSGGKTRRSAKMIVLDDTHPDLLDFISWKKEEEFKARALILSGYTQNYSDDKGAYKTVQAQNANNAILYSDAFMNAVIKDEDWELKYIRNSQVKQRIKAREILKQAIDSIWECGDPGVMFGDTMNAWNTIPNTGRIRGTNPCAEYIHPDGSCSLNSVNLEKFLKEDKSFFIEAFMHVIGMMTIAQEIIVSIGSFPNKHIAEFTRDSRPIGIGYCNMGGLIMLLGYPYDSDQARSIISTITSLLTAGVYAQSARIAAIVGPFNEYNKNKTEFNKVIKKHIDATIELKPKFKFTKSIHQAAIESWNETQGLIHKHGSRNSQATVIAPTGTISFLLGTTNTGIEPSFSLISYKMMSDGSMVELICNEAFVALKDLGYNQSQIKDITEYIKKNGHVEGSPHLNPIHYSVFDTANVSSGGKRYIRPMAHVEAVASAAPFLSGGISKTINLPEDATREDIWDCIIEGWKMGVKGLALYRSGSKWSQPLNSKNSSSRKEIIKREVRRVKERINKSDFYKNSPNDIWEYSRGLMSRKRATGRAPSERLAFNLGGENIWMNVVRYPDNGISEVWMEVGKENPTVNGLADTIGRIVSVAIQYGVPIESICETMEGLQFQPAGFLGGNDLQVRSAKSLSDLAAKVLTKLHQEYTQIPENIQIIDETKNVIPIKYEKIEDDEPEILSEVEQAKIKGFSGTRCEHCGSWKCVGTIKCGTCLNCQTAYGTCSG